MFYTFGRLWINPDAIDAVDQGDNTATTVYLRGGQTVVMSGDDSKAFKKWFQTEIQPGQSGPGAQHRARAIMPGGKTPR